MAATAGTQQNGVLEVLTFTGTQPFVVRCERDTRVKDIVGAIAEIWGFKEAARLFTLCQPAPGSNLSDPTKLFPGTLLSWTDSPCQVAAATAAAAAAATGSEPSSQDATATAAAAGAAASDTTPTAAPAGQQPRLLLVRYIFGSTASEWDQNHSVLSLTAAQITADVAAARYPGVAEAGLYQHWVKQGQHSVVLHMAASWPSGACLIVGPATVLSGGAALQLGPAPINVGLNSKGIHIMSPQQHKLLLPLDSIVSATPAGDVLNIRFASGQPDLLLQVPGAEAVAEAFKFHQTAAGPRPLTDAQPAAPEGSSAAGSSGPASGKRGAPHMPLWITSPSVERWLQEPTPKDDGQAVSVSIKVLRPWEQTPPALRVLLTAEETTPDDRLLEAQLLVVEDAEDEEAGGAPAAAAGGAGAGAAGTPSDAARQSQPRVKLQLQLLPQPPVAPERRVKMTIAPVPEAEQELLMPAPGEEPLVRLMIKPRGERPGAASSSSPLNMLRMLHKGAGAGLEGAADGVMLRGMQLGGMAGGGSGGDERPHPQLMQRLQQQQAQQQEVRQGLLAGTHLGGPVGQPGFHGPGMRPAYGVRPSYGAGAGYRPNLGAGGMQQQGPGGWAQQQQQYGAGGMMARPPGMRPMGALPHQPYTLAGPPNNMMGAGQVQHRPGMVPGGMQHTMQGRPMRPQQQQYPGQMQQQQQQQFGGMRQQPQQQQQFVMQQGRYMVVQQPQQQQQQQQRQQPMLQHQQQVAYAAMPQQQQQQQMMMMMQANPNAGTAGSNMVLVTTADGRQLLVHDTQLAQPQQQAQQLVAQQQMQQAQQQQQQQQVMPGVFVLGAQGELMPASQPGVGAQRAAPGMQQMMLQQPAQLQQQPMMVAQGQGGQPMFVQPTPSQKLQQYQQAQQMQQVQYQQPQQQQQQQRQMGGMAGLGPAAGQYDQLGLMAQQQQQLMQQQAQPMGMVGMDMNGQLQLQAQQAHQQQFVAVSSAAVGGQATQLLQLQGMQGMVGASASMAQPGFVLQGQQPQQQQILVDDSNMGLLQQQMPRNSNGTNMVMTSAGMFGGQQGMAAPGLGAGSGPGSNGGGINSLGLLQQGAPGLGGIPGSAAPGLSGMSLGGGMGGMGGVGGLGAPGSSYLNSFDPLRQPNSTNSGLGLGGGGQTTADPPGLNYGSTGQAPGSFLQQQQQPQQQMFTLTNDVGGVAGLGGGQDALQGGLQGGVLSDGYLLSNDGMTLTGGAPGLGAPAFGTQQQQFNTPGFY